uniref:NIDO domain-containing protein n=1 Tax=Ditylenchus dipsaci TaxID=166011 RepID=A0A915D6S6_9BILA
MAEQRVQYVGTAEFPMFGSGLLRGASIFWSNLALLTQFRPPSLIGYNNLYLDFATQQRHEPQGQPQGVYSYENPRFYRTYRGRQLKTQEGRLEDPEFLDQITNDIRHGMVGARGWKADYALLVTWERMTYGGSQKITELNEYERAKRWQNTYQMVIATDEIRSYCMFNFANINCALVGFNGGNGTGYVELPYSAEGNSYKLVQYGSTQIAGRWLARIDEQIQYGGCSNESRGTLEMSQQYGNMLGGFALNVSGPCYRPTDIIKLQFDEITIDCERIDMVIARCVIPVNNVFRTVQPGLARRRLNLVNDAREPRNNWNSFEAQNLTLTWEHEKYHSQLQFTNRSSSIRLLGHSLKQIGYIARRHPNNGLFTFNPRTLMYDNEADPEAWRCNLTLLDNLQVRVSDTWLNDRGDGMYCPRLFHLAGFFQRKWEYEYGRNWAWEICQQWYDYDGRRENFFMEMSPRCPVHARWITLPDCDAEGDHRCYYTQGAKHCVISTFSVWTVQLKFVAMTSKGG